jgi:hypothetical protein
VRLQVPASRVANVEGGKASAMVACQCVQSVSDTIDIVCMISTAGRR